MSDYDLNWDNGPEQTIAALRSRLAEVEADVDRWQRIAASEGQANTEAEARLAEAIELLREMADAYDEATGDYGKEYAAEELNAARAFIEAHGTTG